MGGEGRKTKAEYSAALVKITRRNVIKLIIFQV